MRTAAAAFALSLSVRVASACPVCFDSSNPTVLRFYSISTMFLSFLPFALVGGLVFAGWYLRKQALAPGEVFEPALGDEVVAPVPGR